MVLTTVLPSASTFLRGLRRLKNPFLSSYQVRDKSFCIKNNEEFLSKVMNSQIPVIVNFHAEWCDPCHILTPKLRALTDQSEEVNLAIVDVEANPELVHTFEVKAVPAVLAIRNGLVVDKFIGLVDATMIEKLVNRLTGKCMK
ncbi:thioredoxin, mitochondrial [Cimex lectularius]|uniref:Thioredoxin domain-containing protein n=1 Tax=Cimex lectularius TaxID=79782 RepID=A0A8I6RPC0_CIMLE|nr:thioredoxin, mitochondrial [Cimex lectularius]XP_014247098.1 thioredoxin, mitochondrial [Cimex lectularius]XP_024084566.1 thioredoxin, mitochondrial [Cimex lectularius]